MKVALIGATGFIGSEILKELLRRGHKVTAIARDASKVKSEEGVLAVSLDIADSRKLAGVLQGQDAVASAYNPGTDRSIPGAQSLFAALRTAALKRVVVVGGAGSLVGPDGKQFVDGPSFPAEWKAGALATREILYYLREQKDLEWTFLSPAFDIHPGERTGHYRTSLETPVFNAKGESKISAADYAIAFVDELEKPKHVRERFTVGY